MPKLYQVVDDAGPTYVLADSFRGAIAAWRDCWNERDFGACEPDEEPVQVVLLGDHEDVYLPPALAEAWDRMHEEGCT